MFADKSILIARPDNLGDVVLFSGALRLIKQAWPGAHVTICVKDSVSSYLELCPYVDSVITWENTAVFLIAPPSEAKFANSGACEAASSRYSPLVVASSS